MIFVFPIDVWGVPLFGHDAHPSDVALFTGGSLIAAGLASEFIIGVLALCGGGRRAAVRLY